MYSAPTDPHCNTREKIQKKKAIPVLKKYNMASLCCYTRVYYNTVGVTSFPEVDSLQKSWRQIGRSLADLVV